MLRGRAYNNICIIIRTIIMMMAMMITIIIIINMAMSPGGGVPASTWPHPAPMSLVSGAVSAFPWDGQSHLASLGPCACLPSSLLGSCMFEVSDSLSPLIEIMNAVFPEPPH